MSRFARNRRVFFFEEPIRAEGEAHFTISICQLSGVHVVTPVLPHEFSQQQATSAQRHLLQQLLTERKLKQYVAWYYTPMAMEFTSVLDPVLTVYDCMDELTAFAGAPSSMKANEAALFQQADLVFTGGASLFASKREQHPSVFQFPSSVDTEHFSKARSITSDPIDQALIPHPRLGYAGVIDERMDLDLLVAVAQARPSWQFVLLGPIVKIDPASIPKLPNLHLLGMKKYPELPEYLAGWKIGMLPFALNEATKFISPTKTPEYLAAGLQVISTPIRDVVTPYGEQELVSIADGPQQFIAAVEKMLEQEPTPEFAARVHDFLARSSWDTTWSQMERLMESQYAGRYLPNETGKQFVSVPSAVTSEGAR